MDYFPLSLASGETFCNRKKEQDLLNFNIAESRPTLIVSPRRYGKTSLALHTITRSKFHYAQFDFMAAVSESDIEKIIFKGIGQLLGRIEQGPKKLLKVATDLFSGLSIKLSFDKLGLAVEINRKSIDSVTTILNILERIEKLSRQYHKKIVLLFDEFQRVYQVSENQAIESVIRQVAQTSKQLSFIFSGSNRHLLYQIFNDRNRPFYKLCERVSLGRISEEDYIDYIHTAAKKTLGLMIEGKAIERVFYYTERHPYYVNLLCSRLWKLKKITPTEVDNAWNEYVMEEQSLVANEIELLSDAQRKLLVTLSRCHGTKAPRSKAFQLLSGMPGATIAQALKFLEQKDYVYKDSKDHYKVLDPLIKSVLESI